MSFIKALPSILSKTAAYTVSTNDGDNVQVNTDASSGAVTITLYAASTNAGKIVTVKKTDSSVNAVTIDGNASETIDGATTLVLAKQYDSATLTCNGTNWTSVAVAGQTFNGQTISSAASLTGTLAVAGATTLKAMTSTGTVSGATVATFTAVDTATTDLVAFERSGSAVRGAIAYDNGGFMRIGTSTNHEFKFRTNNTDWMTLSTAGLLTVSGSGTNTFTGAGNAQVLNVINTQVGAAGYLLANFTSGSTTLALTTYNQSYTTYGGLSTIEASGALGLGIYAQHASGTIKFYSGGTTLAGTFDTSQQLSLANNLFLGLGTYTNPAVILNGTASGNPYMHFQQNSVMKVELQYLDSTDRFNIINVSGGVYLGAAGTAWAAISDARLKTALTPFSDAAAKLRAVRTGTGRYLTDDPSMSRSFLIAQDWQKILPEAVDVDSGGMLSMRYTDTIPFIISAWQQHDATIAQLAARIAALESQDN